MDPDVLSVLLETWGYFALLALLILTGVGFPIPEDLLLVTAGYFVSADIFTWPFALVSGGVGVVVSDLILYAAGRHIAWRSARWPEGHFLSPERLQRATRWFARCGPVIILIARLVPGTRAIVFVTAGVHAIPPSRFLGYDILGAAVWVPAMLAFGHAVGRRVGDLESVLDSLDRAGPIVLLFAAGLLLTWFWLGREESKL